MRVPHSGRIATGRKISNIEQGMPNRRSKANPHLEIRYSLFDILRFKCLSLKHGLRDARAVTAGKHTPENVKLLLPHRQSRWISQRIREALAAVLASNFFIGPRTYPSPCPCLTAENMQHVDMNAFDLIAGAFYSSILSLSMAFWHTFTLLQGLCAQELASTNPGPSSGALLVLNKCIRFFDGGFHFTNKARYVALNHKNREDPAKALEIPVHLPRQTKPA